VSRAGTLNGHGETMGARVCRRCESQRALRARVAFKAEGVKCSRRSDAASYRDGAVG